MASPDKQAINLAKNPFLILDNADTDNTQSKYDHTKPPVGPNITFIPPLAPAKTGKPHTPINSNNNTETSDFFQSSIIPVSITAKILKVIGTGPKGIAIGERIQIIAVKIAHSVIKCILLCFKPPLLCNKIPHYGKTITLSPSSKI